LTHEQHIERHVQLFKALDELVADWMGQTDGNWESPVSDLVGWAKLQTLDPSRNEFRPQIHLPTIEVDRG
jgi:hypothetical protein